MKKAIILMIILATILLSSCEDSYQTARSKYVDCLNNRESEYSFCTVGIDCEERNKLYDKDMNEQESDCRDRFL